MNIKFIHGRVPEPKPGCSYGKYVSWCYREYGRQLFSICMNAKPSELPDDPWEPEDFGDPLQDEE